MNGTGATVINGTLTISQGNSKFLGQRTLTTAGNTTITPNGTGNLDTGDGAVWTNLATIDDQASLLIRYQFGTFAGPPLGRRLRCERLHPHRVPRLRG